MDSRTRMNAQNLGHFLGGVFQDVPELSLSLPDVNMTLLESAPLQQTGDVDIEILDDEVSIISSGMFYEGRQNSRSNQSQRIYGSVGIIYENVEAPGLEVSNSRERERQRTTANGPLDNKKKASDAFMPLKLAEPVPTLKAPTLTCPICMDRLKEETTTKCGHIFCLKCIKTALATQSRCPTCRQKITKRGGIFRIYLDLPASSE